ncbi:MAG: toll/interleukin-1 receptor domain-containing protein [Atopobiaceae bacterium]|nr:toll/interleukin-1 receptor domain-containing protein [Atopobiaceae bacterium]
MRVFISHSSQNKWLLDDLIRLIRKVNPQASVFCSSEIPIDPGDDYKEVIFRHLQAADLFVAIVSYEYWKSKYCVFEFGVAYHRHIEDGSKLSIVPLLLPPLDKAQALANTPIVNMQVGDITDFQSLKKFLKKLLEPSDADQVDGYDGMIAQYVTSVSTGVLGQRSLFDNMHADAFYDEMPRATIPRGKVVRFHQIGDSSFLFEFRLSQLPYTPSFASVALMYPDTVDLREYLSYDSDAALRFSVDNTHAVLQALTVEFKVPGTGVYHSFDFYLHEGMNDLSVPLSSMNKRLSEISEICFVVHPETMASLDGEVAFVGVRIDYSAQDILEAASILD